MVILLIHEWIFALRTQSFCGRLSVVLMLIFFFFFAFCDLVGGDLIMLLREWFCVDDSCEVIFAVKNEGL